MKEFYRVLMKQGYKLHEIDEMDIHFYWELLQEKARSASTGKESATYAEDVPWL